MAVADFRPIFDAAGKEWNIDPALLMAVAHQESGGNPKAVSPKGARGLMQIMPRTGQELGLADPHDPEQSIYAGAKYLSQMLDRFKRPELALAAYNAGPGAVEGGRFPDETLKYVPSVTGHYKRFAASGQTANDASGAEDFDALVKRTTSGGKPTDAAPADPKAEDFDALIARTTGGARAPQEGPPAPQQSVTDPMTGAVISAAHAPPPAAPQAPLAPIPGAAPDSPDAPSPSRVGQPAPSGPGVLSRVGNALASPFVEGGALGPDTSTGSFYNGPMGLVNRLVVGAPLTALDAAGRTVQGVARGVGALGGAALEGMGYQGAGARLQRDVAQLPDAMAGMVGVPAGRGVAVNKLAAYEPIANDLSARIASDVRGPARGKYLNDRLVAAIREADAPNAKIGAPEVATATADHLSPPGKPRSVGAAATPGELNNMTDGEARAYRHEAEMRSVLEPQPLGEDRAIYVPGSVPTKAEYSGAPGVSQAEKVLRERNAAPFTERLQKNNEARVKLFDDLAGSRPQIEMQSQLRSAQAQRNLEAAFGSKKSVDASPVVQTIDDIFSGPRSGENEAVATFLRPIREQLFDANGNLKSDPERLYGIRENVANKINKASKAADPRVANAERELMAVKDALDGVIEQGAPGYKKYLSDYAEASKPIDAMELLQDFRPKLTSGKTDEVMFARFDKFMKDLIGARSEKGIPLAKSLPDETMEKLIALHRDLKRANNIDLGEARGSPTNLRGAVADALGMPMAHGVAGWALGPIGNAALHVGGKLLGPVLENRRMNKLTGDHLAPPKP